MMIAEWVRHICLAFPGTTESVQWGGHLVFKVGGKIFAIASLSPDGHALSVKAGEEFDELIEKPGVVPAPYLARARWIALESEEALPLSEMARLLRRGYDEVVAKLPRKTRAAIGI